ncbi:MAG: tryptophan 7-halogenase [Planctomycetes bacterium]|nr:tryptophan 7-halogenase [Planctomycetota bacterium]MCB9890483.1 tryptophan 7-halogenase [Planctomycetota bacterium]MCB9917724.1 tryptophan 7-halogenase [Planctomycetota bacterium]
MRSSNDETEATQSRDVIVIGGGPAGSTAATILARHGYDVAVYEALEFPRVHVGESLIPACNRVLERLGVTEAMSRLGCPEKFGVRFYTERGAGRPFYFSEASDPALHSTWQVRRSEFDTMLLDTARAAGAMVHVRTPVRELLVTPGAGSERPTDRIDGVVAVRPDGSHERVRARVVLDASGQRGVVTKHFGVRDHVSGLENAAVWAHFSGVRLDEGKDAGSTLIYRVDRTTWLWLIPLPDDVSIGVVTPMRSLTEYGRDPASILAAAIEACPAIGDRLDAAERVAPVRVSKDFSYRARREGGRGWALIGDALGFMDPVYSSGLFLALRSAELAADAVHERLAASRDRDGAIDMHGFGTAYHEAFEQFLVIVRAFYSPDFHFGDFAREGERRKGLVDLFTGDVMSEQALRVAREIRERCKLPSRRAS